LAVLYEAFASGRPSPLSALSIQYADFAHWQRQWLQGEVLEAQLAYWKRQLVGAPLLQIPMDHPRPAIQTFRGARQTVVFSPSLIQALKALSQQHGVTLFMTLLAAFKVLLHRYTGQDDLVVGSALAGRTQTETEGLIGFFVNTVVLRTDLSGNPTFRELLARVREVCLGAYARQDLPFERLVEELQPERSLSHSPLFQVMFALQNAPSQGLELPGMAITPLEVDVGTAPFDLTFQIAEKAAGLSCLLVYNSDLFNVPTIVRMLGHFQTLLEGIAANPAQRIGTLPLVTDTERHQLLVEWNDTRRDYLHHECLHQLFEAQVERRPDAMALVFEDEPLTYGELNRRANQLAHYLRALGVGPEVLVGICMERSAEMNVGLLGILKAGGAYVPLDPTYPQERLAFMLTDTQAPVLVTHARVRDRLPAHHAQVVCLDRDWKQIAQAREDNPSCSTTAAHLAYVLYTSGSTGTPKGVAVPHRAVTRLVRNTNYVHITPDDVVAQVATCTFDAAPFEIWGALVHGARLVVLTTEIVLAPHTFATQLVRQGVTVLFLTTALFKNDPPKG
jgi:aspartate racemase